MHAVRLCWLLHSLRSAVCSAAISPQPLQLQAARTNAASSSIPYSSRTIKVEIAD